MTVTIRRATAEDADIVAELVGELNANLGEPVDHFTRETALRDLGGGDPAISLLMAEEGGRAAGYVLYHDSYDTTYAVRGVYVCDLYVRPDFQRRGIGKKLLKAVARDAASRERTSIWWASEPSNRAAQEFYKSIGAKREPVMLHALEGAALQALLDDTDFGGQSRLAACLGMFRRQEVPVFPPVPCVKPAIHNFIFCKSPKKCAKSMSGSGPYRNGRGHTPSGSGVA